MSNEVKTEISGEEFIQRYRTGSPALNEMRKDVEDITNQFANCVPHNKLFFERNYAFADVQVQFFGTGYSLVFGAGTGAWVVYFERANRYNDVTVSYYTYPLNPRKLVYSTLKDHGRPFKFPHQYVQEVRQALPDFVEGILRVFPEILDEFQPILDATPVIKDKEHRPSFATCSPVDSKYCLDCGKLASFWGSSSGCIP